MFHQKSNSWTHPNTQNLEKLIKATAWTFDKIIRALLKQKYSQILKIFWHPFTFIPFYCNSFFSFLRAFFKVSDIFSFTRNFKHVNVLKKNIIL